MYVGGNESKEYVMSVSQLNGLGVDLLKEKMKEGWLIHPKGLLQVL